MNFKNTKRSCVASSNWVTSNDGSLSGDSAGRFRGSDGLLVTSTLCRIWSNLAQLQRLRWNVGYGCLSGMWRDRTGFQCQSIATNRQQGLISGYGNIIYIYTQNMYPTQYDISVCLNMAYTHQLQQYFFWIGKSWLTKGFRIVKFRQTHFNNLA